MSWRRGKKRDYSTIPPSHVMCLSSSYPPVPPSSFGCAWITVSISIFFYAALCIHTIKYHLKCTYDKKPIFSKSDRYLVLPLFYFSCFFLSCHQSPSYIYVYLIHLFIQLFSFCRILLLLFLGCIHSLNFDATQPLLLK